MRRWNGWGDDSVGYELPPKASEFLKAVLGPGEHRKDAVLEEVVASVPESRLPGSAFVVKDPESRLRHARGQSMPDWIALRSGRIGAFPDGVAYPMDEKDVHTILRYARQVGAIVIPYGGGTSVVGHVNPPADGRPALTVDMGRMNRMIRLDSTSHLATFGAGVAGPDLEAILRAQGFTLGHFPQSFEYSTLGGWITTRSSGQQSLGYGSIDQLFAGGKLVSPRGTFEMPPFPDSSAGPDLRHVVLGSEGRLGILTEATVRVSRLPEREDALAIFFPDFANGMDAAREMLQSRLPLSMLRLSSAEETRTTLIMAGHEKLIGALERLLSVRKLGEDKCLMLVGLAGNASIVKASRKRSAGIASGHGGVNVGRMFAREWLKNRFRTPYLRNTLWEMGYAVDTVESATWWSNVPTLMSAMEHALQSAISDSDERVHVFTHLSHLYPTGSNVYTTFIFRISPDPDETLERWQKLKSAVSEAIVAHGGTISHQHGVGTDHLPYLEPEKGQLGIEAIHSLLETFDPKGMMNPGKLVR